MENYENLRVQDVRLPKNEKNHLEFSLDDHLTSVGLTVVL